MTAIEFNERYSIGTTVNYHSVIGEPEHFKTETRSEAWTLASGHAVVKVKGKSGCVPVEAISVEPELERYIDLGLCVESHPLLCQCDTCKEFISVGDAVNAKGLHA